MMNNYLILDIETDDINATRIWVVCSEDYKTGDKQQFLNIDTIPEERVSLTTSRAITSSYSTTVLASMCQ